MASIYILLFINIFGQKCQHNPVGICIYIRPQLDVNSIHFLFFYGDGFLTLSGPEVMKLFSCSTQLSMKFVLLIKSKLLTAAYSFLLNIAEHENFSANKMKMLLLAFLY